jgi:hypothetical protein
MIGRKGGQKKGESNNSQKEEPFYLLGQIFMLINHEFIKNI